MQSNSKSLEICVKPLGGLCNRMRVIDSAIALSKATNSNLHVIWQMNSDLNCRFEDLFNIPPSIHRITQTNTSDHLSRLVEKIYRTKIGGIIQSLYLKYIVKSFDLVLTYDRMERYKNQNYLNCNFPAMAVDKQVYITTVHTFYNSDCPFGDFVPIERLQQIIDKQSQNFDNVVGVHLRRTDNQQSLVYSSTARFIELMQAEIERDGNTQFFVATDSSSEEEYLQQIFPDRIITYAKKSLERDNPVAIQDAVVDLYCLSKCRNLIGSYYSSFTDTAHQINGIDYLIVKNCA